MSAWLISALRLLAGVGRSQTARVAAGAGTAVALADPAGGLLPDIFGAFRSSGAGDDAPRRRRRRRALTASDRSDIAFIAGVISKSAADRFAVQLATRPR